MTRQRSITRLKRSVLPVLCLIFTLFGYGPAELYLSNKGSEEFWFAFSEILWPIIIIGLLACVIIMGVLMIIPTKGYHIVMAVIIAIAVLFLVQGLFLPNNYGSLNGAQIDWSQYTGRLIYNTAIWLAVIIGAVFWAVRNWKGFRKIMQFAAAIVLLIQVTALVTTGLTSPDSQTEKDENVYLTTNNLYTVSEDKNTIVFVLDAFDSQIMCDLLEEYPEELQESYKDFTFYHNTSGGATRTKYAIPFILTGKTNDTGGTYAEYLKESFQQSPLFQELRTGKYNTGFYTEYGYVDRTQTEAIDNLSSGGRMHATSQWGLSQSMLKMTAFKYAPHILKSVFWMYSFELAQWRGGDENQNTEPYKMDDIRFYNTLQENGLIVEDKQPSFRFIHLKGAHGPFRMDENIKSVSHEENSEKKQGLGALRIVAQYIQKLKELNLYDTASIFIMADHGDKGYIKPNYEQNPLFMVKEAGANKEFSVSDIRLSYHNVTNMLADSLQQKLSIEEYITNGTRYFYSGVEGNNTYKIVEYASEGNAYDTSDWHTTGKAYLNQTTDISYTLGTKLFFGESGGSTARKHFVTGFTYLESKYVWTNGKEVELKFDIGTVEQNLLLSFDYVSALHQYQRVYLFAGEQPIASFIARKAKAHQYIIPKEAVTDGILDIKIQLPDAASPHEEGTGVDGRILGIAFKTITIDLTDLPFEAEKQLTINQYQLGQEITFGKDGNISDYAISGISQDHWTSSKTVTIHFDDIQANADLKLTMAYKTYGEQQHVIIFANGEAIADYTATGKEEKEWTIPQALLKNGVLYLEISLPDAKKPDNGDRRELGLWMQKMVLQGADLQ